MPGLCLKDPLIEVDTIYLELLTAGCWLLKDKKNFPLAINNYLLKSDGVTIIYTKNIYEEIFWETDKWGIWLVKSFYLTQFFGEWDFCGRGFSSCRDFFSYSPVFGMDIGYLLSSNPKNIYFY